MKLVKKIPVLVVVGLFLACFGACGDKSQLYREESKPGSLVSVDDTLVSSSEAAKAIAPSTVESVVKLARSGSKYVLKMSFSFTGPKPHAWEIHWFADGDDGRDELFYMGQVKISGAGPFEAIGSELYAGRLYNFKIQALIFGNDSQGRSVSGNVTYKKITVDLRGVER